MCGRISIATRPSEMIEVFDTVKHAARLDGLDTPKYNIGPTVDLPAIRLEEDDYAWVLLRWGLVPSWARDVRIGNRMINARAESIAEKPSFRSAYKMRRCLLPITSFYEWKRTDTGKQPLSIYIKDESLFTLAGIWEEWTSPEGEVIESCTIVTTEANSFMESIHDRMPVIVAPEERDVWLEADPETAQHVMRPFDSDRMDAHLVSTYVNNVRNQGPECIQPLTDEPRTLFG